uniref:Secreted protein n=1 Tax=Rhabditophanes sp. KR3021 TaxID=114890 RepID=A0AC35TMH3_9BILA
MSPLFKSLFFMAIATTLIYSFAVINRPLHADGTVHARRNDNHYDQKTLDRFDNYIKQSFSNYEGQTLYQDKTRNSRICFFTPVQCRLSSNPRDLQIVPLQTRKDLQTKVFNKNLKNQLEANLIRMNRFENLFKTSNPSY